MINNIPDDDDDDDMDISMDDDLNDDFQDDSDDEFIDDDDDDDAFGDFAETAKTENTLADLWQNNPLFKIGVIFGGAALLFGVIILLSSGKKDVDSSYVPTGSDVTAAPGTTEATPAFIDAVKEANQAEVERAIREGDSAIPVPVDTPVGRLKVPDQAQDEQEDPLDRWRQLQQERLERELAQQETLDQQNLDTGNAGAANDFSEDVKALADVMSQQMQSILENRSQVKTSYMMITPEGYMEQQELLKAQRAAELAKAKAEAAAALASLNGQGGAGANGAGGVNGINGVNGANGNADAAANGAAGEEVQNIIFPAGQIAYAQLLTEANSDTPGPVLAQIVSGPLAGNRVLGSFETQEERLTLNFNTIIIDGVSQSIEAVAVDPDTTLPAMATEVDHRYMRRIFLPAAAAFVKGAAKAIAESGRTTITISGETVSESTQSANKDQEIATGVQEAGEEASDILKDMADDTKVLVRIASGTPMGILFLQPVVE